VLSDLDLIIKKPGTRWPCGQMPLQCLSVIFGGSPFSDHWIAVEICREGSTKVWDSCERLGPVFRNYAQLVLPIYAELIASSPSNDWIVVFSHAVVEFVQTPQQTNGHDCGPAAVTTLLHLLRTEPFEDTLDGRCFRFTHLAMIFNEMYGPCPFNFNSSNVPYAPSQSGSLIDDTIVRLFSNAEPPSVPLRFLDLCRSAQEAIISMQMVLNGHCIPSPFARIDQTVLLWNLLMTYGHSAMQPRQLDSFVHHCTGHLPPTPREILRYIFIVQDKSPHFIPLAPGSNIPGTHLPIFGTTGLRSLALQDLHSWFEAPRVHSVVYQTWVEARVAQPISLLLPIIRFSRQYDHVNTAIAHPRALELVQAWNSTFRPGHPHPRMIHDTNQWQPQRNPQELEYIEAIQVSVTSTALDSCPRLVLEMCLSSDLVPQATCKC
jgi:hypothetical protein